MPQWVIDQLTTRSLNSALAYRSNSNLKYLANKTAWVRLVSSVNINGDDIRYFNTKIPGGVLGPSDLAKKFVLFGGTSKYLNPEGNASYELRGGINTDGSYGMLGKEEIQRYGYRPMPGISSVNIETQGRLGSVRQAVISFKCWDKMQLDIIDAIYFKLGYTMFLEWGHTYYYPSSGNDTLTGANQKKPLSSELSILDPFRADLTKEKIFRQIAQNSRQSDGNYDAMLGIVTNFNFSYNQEGGYDCTLRLMSLGYLTDTIKINNPSILPNLLKDEILLLKKTLDKTSSGDQTNIEDNPEPGTTNSPIFTTIQYVNRLSRIEEGKYNPKVGRGTETSTQSFIGQFDPSTTEATGIVLKYGIINSLYPENADISKYDFIADDKNYTGPTLYIQKFGVRVPIQDKKNTSDFVKSIELDNSIFSDILFKIWGKDLEIRSKNSNYNVRPNQNTSYQNYNTEIYSSIEDYLYKLDESLNSYFKNAENWTVDLLKYQSYSIPYKGANGKYYFIKIIVNIPDSLYKSNVIIDGKSINITDLQANQTIDRYNENKLLSPLREYVVKKVLSALTSKNRPISSNKIKIEIGDNIEDLGIDLKSTKEAFKPTISEAGDYEFFDYGNGDNLVNSTRKSKYNNDTAGNYEKGNKFSLTLSDNYGLQAQVSTIQTDPRTGDTTNLTQEKTFLIPYQILITDTSLIYNVVPNDETAAFSEYYKKKSDQNIKDQDQEQRTKEEQQKLDQEVLSTQILDALAVQSALEIILRTIEVKSLNRAFSERKGDLQIGNKVYVYEMGKDSEKQFRGQIFSNGIYSDIIERLLDPTSINNGAYLSSDQDELLINAKYGFATTLLGSNSDDSDIFKQIEGDYVDYKELMTAYVVPYVIDQDLIVGVKTNHPVYIPFGFLLMLLNHSSTIYDTKISDSTNQSGISENLAKLVSTNRRIEEISKKSLQKPLVYIDYNPKLNFFLTNNKQLSTNPWVTLIPIEGTREDYSQLFDPEIVKDYQINAITGKTGETEGSKTTPLFNPEVDDRLSFWLPKIKDGNSYRGKLMNVLINIDYLTDIIRNYSFKDGSNNIYLKPFLEQVLSDVNKYLGNFNSFRVSYNDMANTVQIVDDQIITPKKDDLLYPTVGENRTEIPLVGLNSIAKSIEIKTEITNALGNMIAISANSDIKEQVQLSTNAESFGFINVNYTDRYIPRRLATSDLKTSTKNGEIVSSIQFNQSVTDFYTSIKPSYSDVSQMTSFFIEKMSKVKNRESGSRASSMIPVSVNITTDGMGGLSMGHAFTISDELLPYNYASKKASTGIDGYVNQVGFAIVGLTHTIEGNVWNTMIKANMVAVKDVSAFDWIVAQAKRNDQEFLANTNSIPDFTGATPNADLLRDSLKKYGYSEKSKEISNNGDITVPMQKAASEFFKVLKAAYPSIGITITGGNDKFHRINSPGSYHTTGNGLDFVISPDSTENIAKVDKILKDIVNSKKNTLKLNFLNEYNNLSEKATGKHFHIFYDNNI